MRTYREYENNDGSKSFSMLVAIRFYLAFKVNPACMVEDMKFGVFRNMVNLRIQYIEKYINGLDSFQLDKFQSIARDLRRLC